jgi:O-antigen/teichoic acid export membrane protein
MIAKSLLLISALAYMGAHGGGTAQGMLLAETVASGACLLIALACIRSGLMAMGKAEAGWVPPTLKEMRKVALFNYGSGIVEYLFSTSFLMLVLGRFLPPATVAGAGFVVRMIEMIRNYLPGMLVFSLVRSRMIGNFVRERNFDDLRMWARFLFKISLLTLLPVCGIALVYGRQILDVASGSRYGEFGMLFAVLTFWLALRLHRLILGVVFNAADMMHLWAKASALSLLVLPPLLLIGPGRLDMWFLPAVLISGEVVANWLALHIMRGAGRQWSTGWDWIFRSLAALAAGIAAAVFLPGSSVLWLLVGMAALTLIYCIGALLLRVIDTDDRRLINRSSGRTLFKGV